MVSNICVPRTAFRLPAALAASSNVSNLSAMLTKSLTANPVSTARFCKASNAGPTWFADRDVQIYISKLDRKGARGIAKAGFSFLSSLSSEDERQELSSDQDNYDKGDYRPGMNAAKLHKVRSPLIEAEFTKKDIRDYAEKRNLGYFLGYNFYLDNFFIGVETNFQENIGKDQSIAGLNGSVTYEKMKEAKLKIGYNFYDFDFFIYLGGGDIDTTWTAYHSDPSKINNYYTRGLSLIHI